MRFRVRIGRGVPQTGLVARECGLCGPGTGYTARGRSFCKPDEQGVQTGIGEEVVDYDQLGAFCGRGDPLRQYGLTYDHIGIGRNTVRRTVAHRNADFRVP